MCHIDPQSSFATVGDSVLGMLSARIGALPAPLCPPALATCDLFAHTLGRVCLQEGQSAHPPRRDWPPHSRLEMRVPPRIVISPHRTTPRTSRAMSCPYMPKAEDQAMKNDWPAADC